MSVPHIASEVAPARQRPIDRMAASVLAHPFAVGIAVVLLCGWKFVFGLHAAMDIDPDHETAYLDYLLGSYTGAVPSEYSPLYVGLYAVEHWFARDPIDLFYLNMALLTVALPASLFVYLMTRRVPWLLALPVSIYLLVAMANLPVRPKMMHLALIVIFLALALFARLGNRPLRWGLLLVVCAALSLIRPELIYALVVVAGWCLYLLVAGREGRPPLAIAMAGGAVGVAALYWLFGVPLFGERSVFALAWHFSANYMSWHGEKGGEAFAGDYWAIYRSVFGDAQSIPAAFIANPAAFLHHVATNLAHAPVVLAGDFLFHYNLLLPRYRLFTIVEGGLLAAVLAALLVWHRPNGTVKRGWGLWPAVRAQGAALVRDCPESLLLLLFAAPYPAMILILYPRHHYVLMTGASLLAFLLVVFGRGLRLPATRPQALLVLPLLPALVPSLGSVGIMLNRPYGEEIVAPRPALAEARFLRSLDLVRPINLLEASDPGISPYVAPNFRSVSDIDKPQGLAAFLRDGKIDAVLEDDRLRLNRRYTDDAEWAAFRSAPEGFGFARREIPDAHATLYIKADLLGGTVAPASPVSPR